VLLTAGHKDLALLVARTRRAALPRLWMHGPPALNRWPVLAPLVPGGSHYPHTGDLHNKLMRETYVGSLRRPLKGVARGSGSLGTSGSPPRERRKFRSLTLAVTTALSALLSVLISGPLVAEAATHGLAGNAVARFLLNGSGPWRVAAVTKARQATHGTNGRWEPY
jgi:hypothetical protein